VERSFKELRYGDEVVQRRADISVGASGRPSHTPMRHRRTYCGGLVNSPSESNELVNYRLEADDEFQAYP
jgi:hypothetical protein